MLKCFFVKFPTLLYVIKMKEITHIDNMFFLILVISINPLHQASFTLPQSRLYQFYEDLCE